MLVVDHDNLKSIGRMLYWSIAFAPSARLLAASKNGEITTSTTKPNVENYPGVRISPKLGKAGNSRRTSADLSRGYGLN